MALARPASGSRESPDHAAEMADIDVILPEVELEDSEEDEGARGSGAWREKQARRAVVAVLAASSGTFRHELAKLLHLPPRRNANCGGPANLSNSASDALYDSDAMGEASSVNGGGGGGGAGGSQWPRASDDDRSSGIGGGATANGSSSSLNSDEGLPEAIGADYGGDGAGFCGRYRGVRSPPRTRAYIHVPGPPSSLPTSPLTAPGPASREASAAAAAAAVGAAAGSFSPEKGHHQSSGPLREPTASEDTVAAARSPDVTPRSPVPSSGSGSGGLRTAEQKLGKTLQQPQQQQQQQRQGPGGIAGSFFGTLGATTAAAAGVFGVGVNAGAADALSASDDRDDVAAWRDKPITDITAIYGNDAVPEGFVKIAKSVGGKRADLNTGAGVQYLYLCVRKACGSSSSFGGGGSSGGIGGFGGGNGGAAAAAARPPIVGLAVIFPDRNEYVPPSYAVIRRKGQPVNLNHNTTGEQVYLCYKRGSSGGGSSSGSGSGGNPICDVAVVLPGRGEGAPRGYHLLDATPSHQAADLNSGTGGAAVFLAYRQHMVSLLGLRDPVASELPLDTSGAELAAAAAAAAADSASANSSAQQQQPPENARGVGKRAMSASAAEGKSAESLARGGTVAAASSALDVTTPTPTESTNSLSSSNLEQMGVVSGSAVAGSLLASAGATLRPRTSTVGSLDGLIPAEDIALAAAAAAVGDRYEAFGGGGELPAANNSSSAGPVGARGASQSADAIQIPKTAPNAEVKRGTSAHHAYTIPAVDGPNVSPRLRDLMFLLLTAVNLRHGDASNVAMKELTALLTSGDFFAADIRAVGTPQTTTLQKSPVSSLTNLAFGGGGGLQQAAQAQAQAQAHTQHMQAQQHLGAGWQATQPVYLYKTLLDYAVDAVCNQADQVVEGRFPAVLQFLRAVVQRSSGRLSPASLQRIFQTYSFLCSFSSSSVLWLKARGQLPFGPNDAAYASFKELLVIVFRHVETCGANSELGPLGWGVWDGPLITPDVEERSQGLAETLGTAAASGSTSAAAAAAAAQLQQQQLLQGANSRAGSGGSRSSGGGGRSSGGSSSSGSGGGGSADVPLAPAEVKPFVELLVFQMVDSAVDMVELAILMDGVLDSLRRHTSATSDLLWANMRSVGCRLFPAGTKNRNSFGKTAANRAGVGGGTPTAAGTLPRSGSEDRNLSGEGDFPLGNNPFSSSSSLEGIPACDEPMVAVFSLVSALCKMATGALRVLPNGELVARDLGNKILALDLMQEMLKACGERLRHNRVFGYIVRRMVVSAVLSNCHDGSALMDERAFQLLLGVVRMLWRHFRRHCKVELVVLLEDFLLKVLRASSRKVPAAWRMQVLDELLRWFDIPHNLVELFLNYDMDRKFIRQWKIFQEMCSLVCSMAEGWYLADTNAAAAAAAASSASSLASSSVSGSATAAAAAAALEQERAALRLQALRSAAQIVKSLMDASGHGHLIAQDPKTREISLGAAGGWEEDDASGGDDDDEEETSTEQQAKARRLLAASSGTLPLIPDDPSAEALSLPLPPPPPPPAGADAAAGDGLKLPLRVSESERSVSEPILPGEKGGGGSARRRAARKRRPNSFRYRKELRKRAEEVMKQALDLYHAKGLKKAVQYLVGSSFIADTPHDIANFLRVYRDELDPAAIGEFLSEPDFDAGEYWKLIRLQYVRAISFHGLTLEEALRHLLTSSGFRLPGEAQKIDRLLSAFAECYFADNRGQPGFPFSSAETPYVLSYAIIMLNTDLHRANAGNSKKKRKRMTKDAFISNLRGVAGVSSSSGGSGTVGHAYLSDIYDSIEAHPIALLLQMQDGTESSSTANGNSGNNGSSGNNSGNSGIAVAAEDPFRELSKAAKQGEELLRGLSMFSHRFYVVGQDTSLSLDLVRLMFEAVWFHFHGVINSVLDRAHADVDTVLSCLDVVRYAIGASTFLNMRTERSAFLTQLAKFQHRMAAGGSGSVGGPELSASGVFKDGGTLLKADPWFLAIDSARPAEAGEMVERVHAFVRQLEQNVHETYSKEELYAVARRIRNVDLLDADRRFIREGDLVKSCRSGKKVTYRFFLFSDQVLYAHCSFGGEWRVHEQLLLSLLKIANVKDRRDCRFQMQHPKKTFVVQAENSELKRLWMRDIAQATQALLRERIDSRASLASSIRLDRDELAAAAAAAAEEAKASTKKTQSHGMPRPATSLALTTTDLGTSGRPANVANAGLSASVSGNCSTLNATASASGSPRNGGGGASGGGAMSRLSRSPNFGFGAAVRKRMSMRKLMPGGGGNGGGSKSGSQPPSRRGSNASSGNTPLDAVPEALNAAVVVSPPSSGAAGAVAERGAGGAQARGSGDAMAHALELEGIASPFPDLAEGAMAATTNGGGGSSSDNNGFTGSSPPKVQRQTHSKDGATSRSTSTSTSAAAARPFSPTLAAVAASGGTSAGAVAVDKVGTELAQRFHLALTRYAEEAESPHSLFSDMEKLVIYGLYKQARSGDCPDAAADSTDPRDSESMKMAAWRANYGMSNVAAVETFIETLERVIPDWESRGTDTARRLQS